ncbi:MAG TPA: response regulator transcription factor [Thermoleophilaceae bacterium]|nr:response regulator transcription factor [Thermoleophilaceae bacterium]
MEPPLADIGNSRRPESGDRTRVFILAEIRFYREGLELFFSGQPRLEVVGTGEDAAAAVDFARCLRFDVVLLDMATSGDIDAARMLTAAAPAAAIVALGVQEDEREVISLAEAGVSGFVARDASLQELLRAVESAATGETRCSPRVAAMLARRVSILAQQVLAEPAGIPLTRRQLEIVRLIGEGLPNKAIAQRLFIGMPTVKNHVHNILERLEVHRREDAVRAVRALSAAAPILRPQ